MALEHVAKRAARIKERRLELGITQEAVATRMHEKWAEENPDEDPDETRGQMVSDWERVINSPTNGKLELLAKALDTTVADLNSGPMAERDQQPQQTPDLLGANGNGPTQLDRIEAMLSQIIRALGLQEQAPAADVEGALAKMREALGRSEQTPAQPGSQGQAPQHKSA